MGITYRQTVSEPGDTENVLLRKILQRLNGIASDDTDAMLLAKILDQLNGIGSGSVGGAAVWGDITGLLADQIDLQAALNAASGTPGGAFGDLQFNNVGAFGGFGDFNSGTLVLTLPGNVTAPTFTGNLTGNVTGSSSLNVLKAGDTMTGLLTLSSDLLVTNKITTSNRRLLDAAGNAALDWGNRLVAASDLSVSMNWNSRLLSDAVNSTSVDWNSRILVNGVGATVLSWSAASAVLTGSSSLNVLKAGDTMTGLLTIAQAAANTSAFAISGYSLTAANAQSLLSMTGTWNTSGNPVALRLAITDTASGATSKFLEFLGGAGGATSLFNVMDTGQVQAALGSVSAPAYSFIGGSNDGIYADASSLFIAMNGAIVAYFNAGEFNAAGGVMALGATYFRSVGTGIAEQRNSTAAQTFRVYRTWTDASNYERLALQTAAGQMILAAETAGTGTDNIDLLLTAAGTGLVNFTTGMTRLGAAFTVATLPAAGTQGRVAYVTDSLAPAFLATVVGGGAIITTVFDNGTNWVAA